jgi:hypothetical protein
MQMKKIFVLLAIFVVLFGCKENQRVSESQNSSKKTTSSGNNIQNTANSNLIDLRLKPVVGKEYIFRNELVQDISQRIDTINAETKNTQTIIYSLKPVKIDSAGTILFQVSFKSIQHKIVSPLFTVEVNTSKPNREPAPLEIFYSSLIGKTFGLKVNSDGKNVSLISFDSVLKTSLEQISKRKEFSGVDKNVLSQLVNSFFNPNEMRKNFEKLFEIYPSKKVSVGENWTIDKEVSEPIPAKISNTFLLKNISNDTLFLVQDSKITFKKQAQKSNEPQITELSGNQSGNLSVSRSTGVVLNSKVKQQINLVYTFPPSPQTNNKQVKVVTNIKSNFVFELQ